MKSKLRSDLCPVLLVNQNGENSRKQTPDHVVLKRFQCVTNCHQSPFPQRKQMKDTAMNPSRATTARSEDSVTGWLVIFLNWELPTPLRSVPKSEHCRDSHLQPTPFSGSHCPPAPQPRLRTESIPLQIQCISVWR